MLIKAQNAEVFRVVTTTGKSLMQLYVEMRDQRDLAYSQLADCIIGTFPDRVED